MESKAVNESNEQSIDFYAPVGNAAANVAGDQRSEQNVQSTSSARDANVIQGDYNSIYNIRLETYNKLLEERVEKLQSDFINFERQLKDVISLTETFKNAIEEVIESLAPEESEIKSKLFNSLQQAFKYLNTLQDIKESSQACQEAAAWLSSKRREIVEEARILVVRSNFELRVFAGTLASSEQVEQFCKDIDMYLVWISHHMNMGKTPTPLPKGAVVLPLPIRVYLEVFNLICNQKICIENGLSKEAVIELKGYLNRFVITPLSHLPLGNSKD